MKKIELNFYFWGENENNPQIILNEATGTLNLDDGQIVISNIKTEGGQADLLTKNTSEEISCMGKDYEVVRAEDDARSISEESLRSIKEALGFEFGYKFTLDTRYEPFDLLKMEKDAFYAIVEHQLNKNISDGRIDVKDMDLEFDSECKIIVTLKDFKINRD